MKPLIPVGVRLVKPVGAVEILIPGLQSGDLLALLLVGERGIVLDVADGLVVLLTALVAAALEVPAGEGRLVKLPQRVRVQLTTRRCTRAFPKCSMLRDPEDWASLKFSLFGGSAGLIASFISHTNAPIHASLMNLPKTYAKVRCKSEVKI